MGNKDKGKKETKKPKAEVSKEVKAAKKEKKKYD